MTETGRTLLLIIVAAAVLALIVWRFVRVTRLNRDLRRFRAMIERNSDLITVIAEDGTITYLSPSAIHFLGEPAERLLGTHLLKFVHPDDLEKMQALWEEVLSEPGKVLHTPEFRLVQPDGSTRYAETVGRNMTHDPAVGGVLANTHDVTERRRALDAVRGAEEQLRRAEKMDAVGRLAGGIAHDFNNLLTAIQGYTRLLLDDVALSDTMRADLEQVQQGAARAATLTRQLLAFSRRQLVQPQVMELNGVLNGMQEMLSGLGGPTVTTTFELAPDAGSVRADAGQIEQIVLNLVINALDAMPAGGTIVITTRRTTITPQEAASFSFEVLPGDYVELSLTDSGAGIPAHVLPNIFDPFFTTKPQGKGTGLGLATVYGVVKQSGGYVWALSQEGSGSTFRICLPRVGASAPTSRRQHEPVATGGQTILIVEDEDAVRRLSTRILERAGYSVIAAADGRAAIDLCAKHCDTIHLVLTDVVMPGMNGRQVVEQLQELRPGIRALFASGYTRDAIIEQGFVDPDIEFIEKPFAPDALVQKVRQVLGAPVMK